MKKRKNVRVSCTLHPAAFDALQRLHQSGMWGLKLSQTVEQLLCKALRDASRERELHVDALLKRVKTR